MNVIPAREIIDAMVHSEAGNKLRPAARNEHSYISLRDARERRCQRDSLQSSAWRRLLGGGGGEGLKLYLQAITAFERG